MNAATSINHAPADGRRRRAAIAALLGAALLLAVSTNLAKVAHGLGLAPLPYLAWSLFGATIVLAGVAWARRRPIATGRRAVEYYLVSALLGVAGANLVFFTAVSRVGVSFVALALSLPPILTYAGALALGMERFCRWRALGVVLAMAGTGVLVIRQWTAPGADTAWIALTLLGPVLLSAGNLYRTLRWPPGAGADSLAPGMLAGSVVLLGACSLLPGVSLHVVATDEALWLIALQSLVFAAQFSLMFALQKLGGPVFLSLMGGVGAVFGVPIAMVLLAEPALRGLAPGALFIAAGIASLMFGVTACRNRPSLRSAVAGRREKPAEAAVVAGRGGGF